MFNIFTLVYTMTVIWGLNAGLQKFRDLELKNLKHIIIIGDRKQASIIGSHQTHGYSYRRAGSNSQFPEQDYASLHNIYCRAVAN